MSQRSQPASSSASPVIAALAVPPRIELQRLQAKALRAQVKAGRGRAAE